MAMNNSSSLYFDRVTRTNKLQTINAFAHAVYHLKKQNLIKAKLGEYLDIFRDPPRGKESGAGSYTEKAYDSIYTPALEFGVLEITIPEYKLSDLAIRMVEGEVCQKYFFTTVMMNLNQIINGKVVNPLYETLKFMDSMGIKELTKENITEVEALNLPIDNNDNRNLYFELLSDTYFFKKINNSTLEFIDSYGDIVEIINVCNIELYDKEVREVEEKYCSPRNQVEYTKFITKENDYLKNITMNINLYSSKEHLNDSNSINKLDNRYLFKGINKIISGAPGTGKSKKLDKEYYEISPNTSKRITFHPEYTYNDFVGYIRPVTRNINEVKFENNPEVAINYLECVADENSKYCVDEKQFITYDFVPGPFTEILCNAMLNKDKMYNLIIDEINRANAAAVFGDLFQLLDRDSETCISEYSVHNRDIYEYIKNRFEIEGKVLDLNDGEIVIPNNLNIIATMNTADQNVFTMDTAFKRRWEFEYMDIDFSQCKFKNLKIKALDLEWENFVRAINKFMMSVECSDLMIPEDKQIGPFFIKKNELEDSKKFAYKVLMYLWDDVFKMERERIFDVQMRTFSQVVSMFNSENAINVFNEDVRKILKDNDYIKEYMQSDSYEIDLENETPEEGDVYEEI